MNAPPDQAVPGRIVLRALGNQIHRRQLACKVTVNEPNDRQRPCIASRAALCCDHVQHGLDIGRRASDDAQDFTRRCLLLQRFGELLEQPHVLDGDHRLVGERFEELDLRRGEGAHLECDVRSVIQRVLLAGEGARPSVCENAFGTRQQREIVLRADIRNVKRTVLAHPAKIWLINTELDATQ